MLFWLTLDAATAWLLWYMTAAPGVSYSAPLKPLSGDEARLAEHLRRHVMVIASREHNQFRSAELEASASYIERTFEGYGYRVEAQRIETPAGDVRNIDVEVKGAARASEVIVVGAHYDSVAGAVGANDAMRPSRRVLATLTLTPMNTNRTPPAPSSAAR